MKRTLSILFVLVAFNATSQDEFASTAFYTDFKKIYADAQTGFTACKGDKRKSEFDDLVTEYNAKLLLPLADSGKIVFPNKGNPYAIYYFEPDKNRLKIDQRAVSLREAMVTAFEKPLYSMSETVIVNERPLSNSWFFTDANETNKTAATFRMSIYFENNVYYLSFEIKGKIQ